MDFTDSRISSQSRPPLVSSTLISPSTEAVSSCSLFDGWNCTCPDSHQAYSAPVITTAPQQLTTYPKKDRCAPIELPKFFFCISRLVYRWHKDMSRTGWEQRRIYLSKPDWVWVWPTRFCNPRPTVIHLTLWWNDTIQMVKQPFCALGHEYQSIKWGNQTWVTASVCQSSQVAANFFDRQSQTNTLISPIHLQGWVDWNHCYQFLSHQILDITRFSTIVSLAWLDNAKSGLFYS